MLGSIVKDDATRGVARGVENLPGVSAEGDGVAVGEIAVNGWHVQMNGDAKYVACLLFHLLHEETVVLMSLGPQFEGTEDEAVAHAMVEMAVRAEQMTRHEFVLLDIVDNGLAFFGIVGPTIDDDTVAGLVADHIAVLSEHVAGETFDGKHKSEELVWEIDDMFFLEPFFIKETADLGGLDNLLERLYLSLQITAFQTEDAVRQSILLMLGDVFPHDLREVGQGHDGTADHKVVETFFVLTAQMCRMAVLQSDGIAHLLGHADFLARTVDELELTVGKENGQGDTGEATACTEVENLAAGTETDYLGNCHRVKHMVLVKMVDVLAGDDVDLLVPVTIEGFEVVYLLTLPGCKVGEVFADEWMHVQNVLFRISSI